MGNKKKIVILFIIDFLATKEGVIGGTERQLIDKIKRLNKDKFKPILFCLQPFSPISIWEDLDCEKDILHIYSIISLKCWYKIIKLCRFIKIRNVNIIESVFFDSILLGVIAARFAGISRAISCRRDMGFSYNKITYKCLFFINYLTKRVLVNSHAIKKIVVKKERISPRKIDVIYNGIDLEKFERYNSNVIYHELKSIKNKEKIVGIVANCNRNVKRLDVFIKAASEILKTKRNVKFVIVGDGKLRPQLEDKCKKLKVNEFIIWAGRQENIIPYIKTFNIGVITSDSEGFCNAILEYMAAGLAVVATKVGGNEELIVDGETGFLVPPGNFKVLAKKIMKLLNNEELAKIMGFKGKKHVFEKYSWDRKIIEYEKYYEKLLN